MGSYRFNCEDCEVRATTPVCKSCLADRRHQQWRGEIIAEIRAFHAEHGLVPASRDLSRLSRTRAKQAFGSWATAVRVAGFEPYKKGGAKPLPPQLGAPDLIPLSSRNEIVAWARVDPEDRPALVGRRWFLGSDGYAYGSRPGRSNRAMHRFLMDPDESESRDIDHINGNGLDNRRSNLRFATRAQNLQNRITPTGGRSRFRGVVWDSTRSRWQAKGSRNNQTSYIGTFDNELSAAVAAQRWRDEHMPFAQPDPELVKQLGEWPLTGAFV